MAMMAAGLLSATVVGQAAAVPRSPSTGPDPQAASGMPAGQAATGATNLPNSPTDESKVPHYFGPYPNWANSPQVLADAVVTIAPPTATISVGNATIARAFATDTAAATVFGVVAGSAMPAGTLTAFKTWNQADADPALASAGKQFNAYVLRPTAVANEFTVVYDSGLLTVPALAVPLVSELATFPVTPAFAVQAGDVIGWYGTGIPLDAATGTDVIVSPAMASAPVVTNVVTLGSAPLPIYPEARTYSIAANVRTGATAEATATVVPKTGGIGSHHRHNPGQRLRDRPGCHDHRPRHHPHGARYRDSEYLAGVVTSIAVARDGLRLHHPDRRHHRWRSPQCPGNGPGERRRR